jgi:dTDP-4-amino-4,6-dideoxygalactose transaminase
MALTNSPELADRMMRYRSHGITSDARKMHPRRPDEIWNYQQIALGFNYRMTDVQAALGLSQMARLDEFVSKRHRIAQCYDDALEGLPLQTPWQHADSYSSYHLYAIRFKLIPGENTQRRVYNALHASGINVNLHYIPVYRQPYYEAMGFKEGYCPEAEQYFREALSVPMFPSMTEDNQKETLAAIRAAVVR